MKTERNRDQEKVKIGQNGGLSHIMANAPGEVVWLRNLMTSLGLPPALWHCDNQATLRIVANPIFHEHTKNIKGDCHFVHENLVSSAIITCYTPATKQLEHIFTKVVGQ